VDETLIAAAVLLVAGIAGIFIKPTPDQTRPIFPAEGGGHTEPDSAHGHSH
jgi:hypothetical protein